jgi:hypothetical protein
LPPQLVIPKRCNGKLRVNPLDDTRAPSTVSSKRRRNDMAEASSTNLNKLISGQHQHWIRRPVHDTIFSAVQSSQYSAHGNDGPPRLTDIRALSSNFDRRGIAQIIGNITWGSRLVTVSCLLGRLCLFAWIPCRPGSPVCFDFEGLAHRAACASVTDRVGF